MLIPVDDMTHVFHIEENERRRWQNPEAILRQIGLKPDHVFADIGCNDGFFAIPAARMAGEKGKVWGVDVDAEALERLKEKAKKEGLGNIRLKFGEAENTIFCEGCVDIVFFGIDLHDFRDPLRVLENARRMLKPGGKLVDLDWKKRSTAGIGPPVEMRFSEKQASKLIEKAGFRVESVKDSGAWHYLIMAKPMVV
jgi:ubiquinone/menaquinone biosynthesis C-methylase UbiE